MAGNELEGTLDVSVNYGIPEITGIKFVDDSDDDVTKHTEEDFDLDKLYMDSELNGMLIKPVLELNDESFDYTEYTIKGLDKVSKNAVSYDKNSLLLLAHTDALKFEVVCKDNAIKKYRFTIKMKKVELADDISLGLVACNEPDVFNGEVINPEEDKVSFKDESLVERYKYIFVVKDSDDKSIPTNAGDFKFKLKGGKSIYKDASSIAVIPTAKNVELEVTKPGENKAFAKYTLSIENYDNFKSTLPVKVKKGSSLYITAGKFSLKGGYTDAVSEDLKLELELASNKNFDARKVDSLKLTYDGESLENDAFSYDKANQVISVGIKNLNGVSKGAHLFTITAYDEEGKQISKSTSLRVAAKAMTHNYKLKTKYDKFGLNGIKELPIEEVNADAISGKIISIFNENSGKQNDFLSNFELIDLDEESSNSEYKLVWKTYSKKLDKKDSSGVLRYVVTYKDGFVQYVDAKITVKVKPLT